MLLKVPDAGDGISVSTLSVDTSRSGSSASTCSPSFLSQRVTVPSVTLSPSCGMVTETGMVLATPQSGGGRCSGRWKVWISPYSAMDVQRLAGEGEEGLADRLGLGRV